MFPYLSGLFFPSQDRLDVHELLTNMVGTLAMDISGNVYDKFGYDFEVDVKCNSCNHQWTTRPVGNNMVVLDVNINEERQRNLFSYMDQDLSLME